MTHSIFLSKVVIPYVYTINVNFSDAEHSVLMPRNMRSACQSMG